MAIRRDTEELLAAYVDGVGELTPDERTRVEARLAGDAEVRAERDATRAIVDQLRALPVRGTEPDWSQLAQRISSAVGPTVPRVWWRNWRWLVPIGALAAASAAALLLVHHTPASDAPTIAQQPIVAPRPGLAPKPAETEPAAKTQLYLDGETVEVDDADANRLLDELMDDKPDADAPIADEELGLLPANDLGWIDNLDDASIERAEHWLAKKKG
jgi:hypothetical protein